MCAYCNMGDTWFRYDPPWRPQTYPYVPAPIPAPSPYVQPWTHPEWPLEKLKEYHRLLKEVHDMEEKLGCPCEPSKADYLALFEKRIKALEEASPYHKPREENPCLGNQVRRPS